MYCEICSHKEAYHMAHRVAETLGYTCTFPGGCYCDGFQQCEFVDASMAGHELSEDGDPSLSV